MTHGCCRLLLAFVCVWGACAASAAQEPSAVEWHTDLDKAWAASCQNGRPLLLFVTCDNCRFCDKMKFGTYAHPEVAETINRSFVPLAIDGSAPLALIKELNVQYYPSTFIISPQAVILARFDGYLSPRQLHDKLATVRPPAHVPNVAQGR